MAAIALAWELGGGLGHAGRLLPLARELARRGHRPAMILRDLVHTRSLLRAERFPRLQAPLWQHRTVGTPPRPASLAEILLTVGYIDANALDGLVVGWRDQFKTLGTELVVADYAPTAQLAARSLGIASVAVGAPFWIPPAGRPIPVIRPLAPERARQAEASERRMLDTTNRVLALHDAPPLAHAADLFAGDRSLVCGWPDVDHYQRGSLPPGERWYGPTMLPSTGQPPAWPEGSGPRVFAYLKSGHDDQAEVLAALARLGCPTIGYLPDVANGAPAPVASASIRYAPGPLDLARTFADASLCICHAGGGTLFQALLAGVPVLLLPMHGEQSLLAQQVERTGAGVNAESRPRPIDYAALIATLAADGPHRQAARAFAERHRAFSIGQQTTELVDAIEATLK